MYSHLRGINIGSGPHYAEGWLNTDIIPTDRGKQPDILVSINDMPEVFGPKAFKKAYVGHVLEHLERVVELPLAIRAIAYIAETVMVVGPCIDKAIATDQPQSLLDAIRAPEQPIGHPWEHKWTPTEELTRSAIQRAGYEPNIVNIKTVKRPEWPNPSTASWQTAMWFTA